jgi:hypothetical protein
LIARRPIARLHHPWYFIMRQPTPFAYFVLRF